VDARERALDIVMTKDVGAEDIEAAIVGGIEEEREACAKICDEEAEYYRSMSKLSSGYEESVFHRVGAKVAAHLARKIRGGSEGKGAHRD
jgi:hypothetical protein